MTKTATRRVKAKKAKLKPTEVTIREIEARSPCGGEYCAFLRAIKSNVVDSSLYAAPRFSAPRFGSDDPIPLSLILKTRPGNAAGFTGAKRVQWLLMHIPRLRTAFEQLKEKKQAPLEKQRQGLQKKIDALNSQLSAIDNMDPRELLRG